MILRLLAIAGGLTGAAGLSQYPEFSQQYTQNLAGQVEALSVVVEDFDASAARSDLTRQEALEQLTGTEFLEDRRADMTRTFARYETLSDHYAQLSTATPMQRMLMPHRLGDRETFSGTWDHYVPAMPLSVAGAASAGVGFLGGWFSVAGLLALMAWPFRAMARRRREAPEEVSETLPEEPVDPLT